MRRLHALGIRARLLAGFAICLAACCLTGCDGMKVKSTVAADGRIRRAITCTVPKEHLEAARIELRKTFQRAAGWRLREDDLGSNVTFRATSRAAKSGEDPFTGANAQVTRTDEGVWTQYAYSDTLVDTYILSPADEGYVKDLPIEYSVVMPGKIGDATLTLNKKPIGESSIAGGTVVWTQLTFAALADGSLEVSVTSMKHNAKYALALVGGIIVGLVLLYLLCLWLAVARRANAERPFFGPGDGPETRVSVSEADEDDSFEVESDDPIGDLPVLPQDGSASGPEKPAS
jgi:hypothetical protein